MEIYNSFFDVCIKTPTAITIGKFDGIHKGHNLLISEITSKKSMGISSCVITFKNSPRLFLSKDITPSLFTNEEKKYIFKQKGIDNLILIEFNKKFMEVDSTKFIEILCKNLNMKYLVIGEDFSFGYKGQGNVELLEKISKTYGFELKVFKKLKKYNKEITTTYIREQLINGDIQLVNEMLGYEYFILGEALSKKSEKNKTGTQPLYIIPVKDKLIPKCGSYSTKLLLDDNIFNAISKIGKNMMINEGCNNSDSENDIQIEIFISECNVDLNGKKIMLCFYKFFGEYK